MDMIHEKSMDQQDCNAQGNKSKSIRDIVADVEMFWSKTGRQFQRRGNRLK